MQVRLVPHGDAVRVLEGAGTFSARVNSPPRTLMRRILSLVCFWKNVASSDCSSTLSRARDNLSCERDRKKDLFQDVLP